MYFIIYHAQPTSEAQDVEDAAGAFINCYVATEELDEADEIARIEIANLKWEVLSQEEAYTISAQTVSEEGRPYYEEALSDGVVLVFHIYSENDKDED